MRKFNIGDKVVTISTSNYYGNEFHYDKIVTAHYVSDANDEIFTIDGTKITENLQRHRKYSQKHGYDFSQCQLAQKCYHTIKDRDEIDNIISKYRSEFIESEKEEIDKAIEKYENQIKTLQNKINKLKSGRYSVKYDNIYDIQDYLKLVDDSIFNKLK
jgi:hypothetical protein